MWATVNEILTKIDDFVWGPPLMVLIMVGGILLTIRMGVLQIRKLPLALKWMIKNEEEGKARLLPLVHCVLLFPLRSEPVISLV